MTFLAVEVISFSIAFGYGVAWATIVDLSKWFTWFHTTMGSWIFLAAVLITSLAGGRFVAFLIEVATGCPCLTRAMTIGMLSGLVAGVTAEVVVVKLALRGILRASREMPF